MGSIPCCYTAHKSVLFGSDGYFVPIDITRIIVENKATLEISETETEITFTW